MTLPLDFALPNHQYVSIILPMRRNPVKEMLMRKLTESRAVIKTDIDGSEKVEFMTNLEALVDVIIDRAIETRGRNATEAARLVLEYAVGKPKQTLEIEEGSHDDMGMMTPEELKRQIREAEQMLGITTVEAHEVPPEKICAPRVEVAEEREGF